MRIFRKLILAWLAIFIAGCATDKSYCDDFRLVKAYDFAMFYKWDAPNLLSETGLTKEQAEAAWRTISENKSLMKDEEKRYFRVGTDDKKIYYFTFYCPECFGTDGAHTYPMVLEDGEWKKFKPKYDHHVLCDSVHFKELGCVGSGIYEEEAYDSICMIKEWELLPCERSMFDKIKAFFRK